MNKVTLITSNLVSCVITLLVVLAVRQRQQQDGIIQEEASLLRQNGSRSAAPSSLPFNFLEESSFIRSLQCCGCDVPPGPYIRSPNERIITPDPPEPINANVQSNCPHDESGLTEWNLGSSGHVTVPGNTKMILRQTSTSMTLNTLTIPASSELILDDADISLSVTGIHVYGKLTVGSESCRITNGNNIVITLRGNRPSNVVTNVPDPVVKGISVEGGILNLHGRRYYRTWSRLAKTVQPGDDVIVLQGQVNWESGQEIVLVTTAMKDSREWHRNELATVEGIVAIDDQLTAVYLQDPVQYQHLATSNYQGEVGLLSRNIVVQGEQASSEPTDPDPLTCMKSTNRWRYGDDTRPCNELTGYGGHIMMHEGGKGYVEGVELYRMGQTNVLGRYPIHFHLLGDDCPDCYFRDSSVHRSYYRCISVHGTNGMSVQENVAYDVTGYCYYLEDGIEQFNRIEYNLGAHIHLILDSDGEPAGSGFVNGGQTIPVYRQTNTLTLPADVTASAFYITNVHNYVIGNAASGGWSGFAFPVLFEPIGLSRQTPTVTMRPSMVTSLEIDGNTAHSTGYWWNHASGFYWGGALYYNDNGVLEYNAGRDQSHERSPCLVNKCVDESNCDNWCQPSEQAFLTVTNNKVFLTPGVGLGSWSGRMEVLGFECHDCALSLESLSGSGFWIDNLLSVCRTKTPIALPPGVRANYMPANGFKWYDTGQEHIITSATFRNCGQRSNDEYGEFNEYDQSGDRGCGSEADTGCTPNSSVWMFLTHSDQFNPEVMQGTRDITFENCGRRFYLQGGPDTVSGRGQNWFDADGSVTGLGGPSIAGSGVPRAGLWWKVDDEVVYEPQAPLWFFRLGDGPTRGVGHFVFEWDQSLHNQIGTSQCGNGDGQPCDTRGYIKHVGSYFQQDLGLPVTANADIVGPVGGFGWALELFNGAPRSANFFAIEVDPASPMLLSIAYPIGTNFNIVAHARWCNTGNFLCEETFSQVGSVAEVRNSIGNTYHVDGNGVLTFRIIQTPKTFVGRPDFFLPQYSDTGVWKEPFAISRFERNGVRLPKYATGPWLSVDADCPSSDGVYCSPSSVSAADRNECPSGYVQSGYDACTDSSGNKIYASEVTGVSPPGPSPGPPPDPAPDPAPGPSPPSDNVLIRLKNRWQETYLTLSDNEDGAYVGLASLRPEWGSQIWSVHENIDADHPEHVRLRCVWDDFYVNVVNENNNADVVGWPLTEDWWSMRWRLQQVEPNIYRFINMWSDKCMNVGQNEYSEWNRVEAYDCNPEWGSQEWIFEYV